MVYSLTRRIRYPRRWLLVALLMTLSLLLLLLTPPLYPPPPDQGFPFNRAWWYQPPPEPEVRHLPEPSTPWTEQTWHLTPSDLKPMVAGMNGYYVRDWSVGLGWNNLRYIIEASLLHAKLLNRVLVLPSFVYARSCEFHTDVCSRYGLWVDRQEVVGWDGWSGAPLNTFAWKIPIQVMLDIPHLREEYPVILASEFFELHGLDPRFESLAGDWNMGQDTNVTFPSIHVIPNGDYDPTGVVRVDTLQGIPTVDAIDFEANAWLISALNDKLTLPWEDAVQALLPGHWQMDTDAEIEKVIHSAGWVVTHTFLGAGGMDFTKTVVESVKEVAPRSQIRAWVEDYSSVKAEVLLLEGEIHLGRKPGGLRFTSESARDAFSRLVLFAFRPVAPVRELTKTLAERMRSRCGGRMWMAAHMRRGDFVTVGWSMERSLQDHLSRIRNQLAIGRQTLAGMTEVGDVLLPLEGDPFFLATDERDVDSLAYLRNQSAVLIDDILTFEDRRLFGWPLLFTDVLAVIEQSLAVESDFFYGHVLSSFAGGVLNMRAAVGADPRSTYVD